MNEIKPIEYWLNKIHCGDAYELLKQIPSESVDVVITSPPFYGLRTYGKYTERIFDGDPNCSHEWNEYIKPKERGSYGESSWHRPSRDNEPKWNSQVSHFCVKCNAWKGELGLEPDYRLYVKHLVDLFREVKRVLKKTGSFWLNLGDTYAGSHSGKGDKTLFQNVKRKYIAEQMYDKPAPQAYVDLPPKCLMLIPMRVALALIDDGWILRNVIIWKKLNAMPSSAKDRLAQTYEYVLHFVKSRKYYYCLDNIREPHKTKFAPFNLRVRDVKRGKGGISAFGPLKASEKEVENYVYPEKPNLIYNSKYAKDEYGKSLQAFVRSQTIAKRRALSRIEAEILFPNDPEKQQEYINYVHDHDGNPLGKNPGDVWEMSTRPLKEMHFAPFPPELPLRPILATCPPDNGIVLDPLAGSATVALTCELINHGKWDEFRLYVNEIAKKQKWNIKWIMIEMNPEYCKIAEKRLSPFLHKTLEEYVGN